MVCSVEENKETEKIENALYSVATPIGNLSDISFRAIEILKNVDFIASEDTRNTSVLLNKYNISTRLISYHKYSEQKRLELFLNYLKEGKSIALVTDAGTPLISDPGDVLVDAVIKNGYRVIPIPGASAVTTFLSAISRKDEDFKFIGFLPKSKNQIIEIVSKNLDENLIFYESPKRVIETLEIISSEFPNKKITLARELTKKFEEIKTGQISEIIEYYKANTLKGEFVCMLHKSKKEDSNFSSEIIKLKKQGFKDREIAIILSQLFEVNKNEIYKTSLKILETI